jgi:AraC-like DNA-binding protein
MAVSESFCWCILSGSRVIVPAIVYYELIRELLRDRKLSASEGLMHSSTLHLGGTCRFGHRFAHGSRSLSEVPPRGTPNRGIQGARHRRNHSRAGSVVRCCAFGRDRRDYQRKAHDSVRRRQALERNSSLTESCSASEALRLQAARGRMLVDGLDAAGAAFEVGYESPSQLNRAYSRLFGQPPMRHIRTNSDPSLARHPAAGVERRVSTAATCLLY